MKNIFSTKVWNALRGGNVISKLWNSLNPRFSYGAYVGYEISNCNHIVSCLGGEFTDTSVSIGLGFAATVDYFDTGNSTKGLFTGIGYGEGFSFGQTSSYTYATLLTGTWKSRVQGFLTYLNTGGNYGAWANGDPPKLAFTGAIWAMRSIERGILS